LNINGKKEYKNSYSFIFPLDNYGEIAKELILDPFGLKEINLYAINRIEEAYALLTARDINKLKKEEIYEIGKKKLEENLNKIEDRWFKNKRKWFLFKLINKAYKLLS